MACSATAQTATTWQATGSNTWSTPGNWTAGVPGATNTATFSTAGATQFATSNDLTGLTIAGLAVSNTAPQPFSIDGNGFTIGSASGIDMSAASQNLTINTGVTLGANQSWAVAAVRTLLVSGLVDGTGGLTIPGPGLVQVNNANNAYAGGTTITGGVLEVTQTAAANLRIDPTLASPLGTGAITINGGELRLTPFDPANNPVANRPPVRLRRPSSGPTRTTRTTGARRTASSSTPGP